jgi:hypothetical protein
MTRFTSVLSQDLDSARQSKEEHLGFVANGPRLINGHSIEAPAKGALQLVISHRFGPLNDPFYTFFGMNQASFRFGFDYGVSKKLAVGIGRSSGLGGIAPPPTFDLYAKYKLLTQSRGSNEMPVSISILTAAAIDTERWPRDGISRTFADRMYYTEQLLITRKFGERLLFQLTPTVIHRNLVTYPDQSNTLYALGLGGRLKITRRLALTAEYYFNKPHAIGAGYFNPLAFGVDVVTMGHVFQIQLTNTMGLIEPQFIGRTEADFLLGTQAIRLGFNFSRVFGGNNKSEK